MINYEVCKGKLVCPNSGDMHNNCKYRSGCGDISKSGLLSVYLELA